MTDNLIRHRRGPESETESELATVRAGCFVEFVSQSNPLNIFSTNHIAPKREKRPKDTFKNGQDLVGAIFLNEKDLHRAPPPPPAHFAFYIFQHKIQKTTVKMVKVKSNRSKLSSVEENIHLVDKDLESDITLSRPVQDKRKKKTLLLSGGLAVLGLTATLGYLGQTEFNDFSVSKTASTVNSGEEEILSNLDDAEEEKYFQAADADADGHVTKKEFKDFISEQMASEPHALVQFEKCINEQWPSTVDSFVVGEELHSFESDLKDCIHNTKQSSGLTELALEDTHRYVPGEEQLTNMGPQAEHGLYEMMAQSGKVNKKSIIDMITVSEDDYFVEQKLIKCVEKLYPVGVKSMTERQFHDFKRKVTDCETAIVPHPQVNSFDNQEKAMLEASPEDEASLFETIGAPGQTSFTLDEVSNGVEKFFKSENPAFALDMRMCIESKWPADVESMEISKLHNLKATVGECLDAHKSGKFSFEEDFDFHEPEVLDLPEPEVLDLPEPEVFDLPEPEVLDLPEDDSAEFADIVNEISEIETTFTDEEDILSNLDGAEEEKYFQAADADADGHVTKKEFKDFISEQMASEPHALVQFEKCINEQWPSTVDSFVVGEELHSFESDLKDCIHNTKQSSGLTELALEDTHRYVPGEEQLTNMGPQAEHGLYEMMAQSGKVNKKSIIDMITVSEDDYFVEQKLIKCVEKLYPVGVKSMTERQFHDFKRKVTDCETAIVPHPQVNSFDNQEKAMLEASPEDEASLFETIGAPGQTSFTLDEVSNGVEKFFKSENPAFALDMRMCIESKWPADVESMEISKLHNLKATVGECLDAHKSGKFSFEEDFDIHEPEVLDLPEDE